MLVLTERRQNVTVTTVRTLRAELARISSVTCKFSIHKVHRDRVSIRCEHVVEGQRKHSEVVLPAYPTGWPADGSCNNLNVVLDPVEFVSADSPEKRHFFAPLVGHEALAYYEKLHGQESLTVSRCC